MLIGSPVIGRALAFFARRAHGPIIAAEKVGKEYIILIELSEPEVYWYGNHEVEFTYAVWNVLTRGNYWEIVKSEMTPYQEDDLGGPEGVKLLRFGHRHLLNDTPVRPYFTFRA